MNTMSLENGKQHAAEVGRRPPARRCRHLQVLLASLRVGVLLATAAAVLLMGLNKQRKTMVVAVIGTTPISQTLVAKFYHTRAFVYFVIANAMACAYNLLVLLLRSFCKCKGAGLVVDIADKLVLVLVATGAAAAASMAELAKNGNSHARWFPICDKFDTFCHRSAAALIASFLGAALSLVLNVLTAIKVHKKLAIYEYGSM